MKLQKYKRKIRNAIYHQYVITVPPKLVDAMDFEGFARRFVLEGKSENIGRKYSGR